MQEEKLPTLTEAIKEIGVIAISSACGCSVRSIYKWMKKDACLVQILLARLTMRKKSL